MSTLRTTNLWEDDREAAFRRIYSEEIAFVSRRLRGLGVADRDLEDKAQDVFVVFYRRFRHYDPTRPVRPWLGGISFRVASDHRKSAYRRREVPDGAPDAPSRAPSPEAAALQRDAEQVIRRALDTLDWKHRSVFVLHDMHGHTMPEIAEMLSVPLNTLYSRLQHAREKLTASVRRRCRNARGTQAP